VLEALDVRIDAPVEVVQRCLSEIGWAFLFAPGFHASTRHAVGPRKELGIRTAFNLLGPLTNPARPVAQVVGVPRPELTEFLARCLQRLGVSRAWVVHGAGLDELSLCGPTRVTAIEGDSVRTFTVTPDDAGLSACGGEEVRGGDARHNADIARRILEGESSPAADVVLLNSGAALVVAGRARDLRDGVEQSRQALRDGRAARLLRRVVEASRA
jgi:anthranilate phosphoribosyltransferase